MSTVTLNLFCLVDGDAPSRAFPIHIDSHKTVGDLKKLVKTEKHRHFKDFDADQLTLWQVSIPVTRVNLKRPIKLNDVPERDKYELSPTGKLCKIFRKELPENMIHVLVEAPAFDEPAPSSQALPFIPCDDPFYKNICNATESDGWISFGKDIPSTSLNKLYIRESYRTIASSIKPGKNKAIITGTPGIGKSLFLIYLFWKLVKEGKRVLFIYHPDNIYYDGKGGVFWSASVPAAIVRSFWNNTLWCLFDAKGKKEAHLDDFPYELCTFVLSTSPRREMVNDFKKPPVPQVFYMPLWTKAELEAIAPLFPNAIEWRDRFEILGGIPRHVVEDTTQNPTEILEAACTDCSLDDCIKKIGINSTITEKSKVVHSLVHITSTPPFTDPSVWFASQTALNIIVRHKGDEAKHRMRELLAACQGNPLIAALCGYIFEPHAIELLEVGGDFKCHQLVHGNTSPKNLPKETTLVIPSSTKTVVDGVLLSQIPNQLYVPTTSNHSVIDAWIPGIGGFQMTVGKDHHIIKGGGEDLAKLGPDAVKLYWLLPPLYYDTFTKKTPQTIDQYALRIPYPNPVGNRADALGSA